MRHKILGAAAVTFAAAELGLARRAEGETKTDGGSASVSLKQIDAGLLNVGYLDAGVSASPQANGSDPSSSPPAFLPGTPTTLQVMVEDAKRYPATGGWGFGRFVDGLPVDEAQHRTCFACHSANVRDHDYVLTRRAP